jgi:hypothetical protein
MPVFIGNIKASLKLTSWEPNIPKPTVRNELHRKQHIRAHDFQLAPNMTPNDMRNLCVYEIIRLICVMLKSENTCKQTELSKAVDTWTQYTASFRVQENFMVYFVAAITKTNTEFGLKYRQLFWSTLNYWIFTFLWLIYRCEINSNYHLLQYMTVLDSILSAGNLIHVMLKRFSVSLSSVTV